MKHQYFGGGQCPSAFGIGIGCSRLGMLYPPLCLDLVNPQYEIKKGKYNYGPICKKI